MPSPPFPMLFENHVGLDAVCIIERAQEVAMHVRRFGLERERSAQLGDRFGHVPLFEENPRKPVPVTRRNARFCKRLAQAIL